MNIRVLQGYENRVHLNVHEQNETKIYKSLTEAREEAKNYLDDYDLVYLVRIYDSYYRTKFIGYGIMRCFDWHKTLA